VIQSPLDDETLQQLLAGYDATAQASGWLPPGNEISPAMQTEQPASMPAQPASMPAQPASMPAQPASMPAQEEPLPMPAVQPRGSKRRSVTGNVDPDLAFMAAYSQNPVLQKMVEESRNRPRAEADAKRAQSAEQRAQEKWTLERDVMSPLKAEGKRNENSLLGSKVDDNKGNTPYAKAVRDSAVTQTQMLASRMAAAGSPLASQMSDVARLIQSNQQMNPKQVAQLLSPFGDLANRVVGDVQKSQALEAQGAARRDSNSRGWASLNEQRRHNQAGEEMGGQKLDVRMEKDQQKLNEKVAGLNEQDELLHDAQEQKKKVNTGWLSDKVQQGLKYVGLADKDFINLESTIAGVNNQIIKLQAGGNVTASEATRMRQQLMDLSMDDEEFDIKLIRVIRQIQLKKNNAAQEYQRKPGGAVKDAAPISKKLVDKVEGSAPPRGNRVRQNGHTFEWNGSEYVEVK